MLKEDTFAASFLNKSKQSSESLCMYYSLILILLATLKNHFLNNIRKVSSSQNIIFMFIIFNLCMFWSFLPPKIALILAVLK